MTSLWHRSGERIARWLHGSRRRHSPVTRVLGGLVLGALTLVALRSIPELRRYLQMRRL
jgi:hypothetical protein